MASEVDGWLDAARPLLPLQNPLWAFVHNNVLQAFESESFEEGSWRAAALYRARPYLSESAYREALSRGRIRKDVLRRVLGSVPVERFLADPSACDDRPGYPLVPGPVSDHMVRYSVRDRPLMDLLVPVVANYLDQGLAPWRNPWSGRGLWAWFEASVRQAPSFALDWQGHILRRLERFEGDVDARIAWEVRQHCPPGQEAAYCLEALFVMKGWSGMVHRLEQDGALAPVEAPRLSLKDWLAVLLVSMHALEDALEERGEDQDHVAPVAAPSVGLGRAERWQEAYEQTFAGAFLELLGRPLPGGTVTAPAAPDVQVLACMDDRMETFRRALEKDARVETAGVVGFFNVDMRYRALGANRATRQCPPVVEPRKDVAEVRRDGRVQERPPLAASLALATYYQTRSQLRGIAVSVLLGLASFVPLVLEVLLPGPTRRLREWATRVANPPAPTRLELSAYGMEERADIVEGLLSTAGLRRRLSPLVAVVSHKSTTSNNPFRQAYGCGACSGNPGAPNARAFAQMANDPGVRAALAARGFHVPAGTLFVPFSFDTTTSVVALLDEEELPAARTAEVAALRARLEAAAREDATERTARFVEGPLEGEAAAAHVFDRGHDLAQPRPELGHNRVAVCLVGRRALTRGRFLDRRAFLVSYDPGEDDASGRWLQQAVLGTVPVAVNIAMDYFYSRTDPHGFGCGSKLPLNVASLLGVVSGSKSDLRIGLAQQMVELHEPMRQLVLVEAPEERLRKVVFSHARLRRLVEGRWMRLGCIHPGTGEVSLYDGERFVPWRELWPEMSGGAGWEVAA